MKLLAMLDFPSLSSGPVPKGALPAQEWCFFDQRRVPAAKQIPGAGHVSDAELAACTYYEYARESKAIRKAVEVAKTAFANQGIAKPKSPEREAFNAAVDKAFALLHRTGFDLAFWTGLPFPAPWQSLPKAEREKWAHLGAHFHPEMPTPEVPAFLAVGGLGVATMLRDEAAKADEALGALYTRLTQIDRGTAGPERAAQLAEATGLRAKLVELDKRPAPVVVRGEGGVDSFIVQVNWRQFSDQEIVDAFAKWVEANKPNDGMRPPTKRGHKLKSWRASLQRLGIMRLAHVYAFKHMPIPPTGFDGEKYWVKGHAAKERLAALEDFRRLFPVAEDETPLSWQPVDGW